MAIRRFPSRLLMSASAAAATRAQAPPLYRGTVRRLFSRAEVEAMATAAAARGQRARACALGRVRSIRADADAASSAVAAWAHAFYTNRRLQAEAAASIAGERMLQASDSTIATGLRLLYGETAPKAKTPSLADIRCTLETITEVNNKITSIMSKALTILEHFLKLDPDEQATILGLLLTPFAPLAMIGALLSKNVDLSANTPESCCPFVGICGITIYEDDYSTEECLPAVISLVATCGGVAVMSAGGLAVCFFVDLSQLADYLGIKRLLDLTYQTVANMIKGKTPKEIKTDFTPEEDEEVRKENQWALE